MKKAQQFFSVILCGALCVSTFAFTAQAKDKRNYVKSISLKEKAEITIPAAKKTATKTYKVTVRVNGKASKKFTAKTSNKKVATVKVSGKSIKVTAKQAGTAKITVTTKGKNLKKKTLKKTLTLTVKRLRLRLLSLLRQSPQPKSRLRLRLKLPQSPQIPRLLIRFIRL